MNWEDFHKFQEKSGWCGPACIQMVLLAAGIKKSQEEIAKDTYLPWWGTPNQVLIAYLSRYFAKLGFSANSKLSDLKKHIDLGHAVIVNWLDNLDPNDSADGHYSLAIGHGDGKIKLGDPSKARAGIWEINEKEFEKLWYDYLDINRQHKNNSWMLWVDINSIK